VATATAGLTAGQERKVAGLEARRAAGERSMQAARAREAAGERVARARHALQMAQARLADSKVVRLAKRKTELAGELACVPGARLGGPRRLAD
jgi:hypothetical protein